MKEHHQAHHRDAADHFRWCRLHQKTDFFIFNSQVDVGRIGAVVFCWALLFG